MQQRTLFITCNFTSEISDEELSFFRGETVQFNILKAENFNAINFSFTRVRLTIKKYYGRNIVGSEYLIAKESQATSFENLSLRIEETQSGLDAGVYLLAITFLDNDGNAFVGYSSLLRVKDSGYSGSFIPTKDFTDDVLNAKEDAQTSAANALTSEQNAAGYAEECATLLTQNQEIKDDVNNSLSSIRTDLKKYTDASISTIQSELEAYADTVSGKNITVDKTSTSIVISELQGGILYDYGTLTSLVISSVEQSYYNSTIYFTSGESPTTFEYPSTLGVVGNIDIKANSQYVLSICNNIMRIVQVSQPNEPELYLIYNTSSLTNERVDFGTTAQMKEWINGNRSILTGSLKAVRKNVDDNETNFSYFFFKLMNLTDLNLSDFDTTGATTMYEMFSFCNSLTKVNVSNLNTSDVTDMYAMFFSCTNLINLDLSSFDTSNVERMSNMLKHCTNLINLNFPNVDTAKISNWGTMTDMLQSCDNLQYVAWATNKDTVQHIFNYSRLGIYGNTIAVPSALLNEYKSAPYFNDWAEQIVGV